MRARTVIPVSSTLRPAEELSPPRPKSHDQNACFLPRHPGCKYRRPCSDCLHAHSLRLADLVASVVIWKVARCPFLYVSRRLVLLQQVITRKGSPGLGRGTVLTHSPIGVSPYFVSLLSLQVPLPAPFPVVLNRLRDAYCRTCGLLVLLDDGLAGASKVLGATRDKGYHFGSRSPYVT